MFQGISTALTALYADRAAMETTGNNIANVNTEGYTRQRVTQSALGGNPIPSFHSTSSGVGVGVRLDQIERLRDQFLEARGLTEHATKSAMDRTADTYRTIELAFGEPGETGLQSQLGEFWAAWDDLSSNPGDLAARTQVIEQSRTLTSSFQQTARSLDTLTDAAKVTVRGTVDQLNAMAKSVAELNKSIQSAVNSGDSPNALFDQRDLLVSKMSDLAAIRVEPTSAGSITVTLNGVSMVRDDRTLTLTLDETTAPMSYKWDSDGNTATTTDAFAARVTGGQLGGLMDSITTVIPRYRDMLDSVANELVTTVNTQHALGVDMNGAAGGPFFTGTSALTMEVAPAVAADPRLIAVGQTGGGQLDGENARKMADFALAINGPDASYRKLIDVLGVESQRSIRQLAIQTNITTSVDAARESASGVNLDEEMANLVRFQKAYTSAAKYLSVINETMDSLLGMVR